MELIAFGHPSGVGGRQGHGAGTPDRKVRRSACEGSLARNVRRTD